jgi:hypothetical protein
MAEIPSNYFTVRIQPPASVPYLAQQAALLTTPYSWSPDLSSSTNLTTPMNAPSDLAANGDLPFVADGLVILNWTSKLTWDEVRQRVVGVGSSHNATIDQHRVLVYDMVNNEFYNRSRWTTQSPYGWGHFYDSSCYLNGKIYKRDIEKYSSDRINRGTYILNADTYQYEGFLPAPPSAYNGRAVVSMCAIPQGVISTGHQGRLVVNTGTGNLIYWDPGVSTTWQFLAAVPTGGLHSFIHYNPATQYVIGGGGDNVDQFFAVSPTGSVAWTSTAPLPFSCGTTSGIEIQHTKFVSDPRLPASFAFNANNTVYRVDANTGAWSVVSALPLAVQQISQTHGFAASIPSINAILFVRVDTVGPQVSMHLFKGD